MREDADSVFDAMVNFLTLVDNISLLAAIDNY